MSKDKTADTSATTEVTTGVTTRVLQGNDCKQIILLDGNKPYGNGKRSEQGKTYAQYRLGQIVFNVPNDSSFPADHKSGDIQTVSLNNVIVDKKVVDETTGEQTIVQVAGLEFDYHISKTQVTADRNFEFAGKKMDAQMEMFTKMKSQPVSEDFLIQLLQQA